MRENIFKISKMALIATALLQLAMSQIHIEMITKLFVRDVGFFLFLFIISGMIVTFNLSAITSENKGKINQFLIAVLVSIGSGGYFMYLVVNDYNSQEALMFEEIQLSLVFIGIGIAVYLIGSLTLFASFFMEAEDYKTSH